MPLNQQPAAGAPASPVPPPAGPVGAPMAQPSPNDGSKQMGMVQVETAMQMLEQALPSLGMNSPEHGAAVRALSVLSKAFNRSKSKELVPAQIAEMARTQMQSPMAQMMSGGGAPGGGAAPAMPS